MAVRDLRAEDPAVTVLAWEAVEELLGDIPECRVKLVLRLVAAGCPREEIADRIGVRVDEIEALVARGRVLVLTAGAPAQAGLGPSPTST